MAPNVPRDQKRLLHIILKEARVEPDTKSIHTVASKLHTIAGKFGYCLFTNTLGTEIFIQRVACLWSKMPMFQRAGMKEGGEPHQVAFQYLILMVWRPCDLNLVMISSLASKCQDFKVGMPVFQPFDEMKLITSNLVKYREFSPYANFITANFITAVFQNYY